MPKYLSILKIFSLSTIILCAFWMFSVISTGVLYGEYSKLWGYRRLHPDLIPDARTVHLLAMGHDTTYADIFWIQLIQFIGDNIGNGKYLDFTHTILSNITELHPYFTRAYEMDLLMAPILYPDTDEKKTAIIRQKIEDILAHGEKWIQILCDTGKLVTISSLPIGTALWDRKDLKNPCLSGMIPYYLGYQDNNLHDWAKSEYYYKIASMQDDAPWASRFLAILAKSNEWNYLDSALSFLLIGADGYDPEPFVCKQIAKDIVKDLLKKRKIDGWWIRKIEGLESKLTNTKDTKKPESYATNNCFDSTERGIKQIYIDYISEIAKKYPDVSDAKELVKKWVISHIPAIQSQKWFTVIQKDGVWRYRVN